MYDAYCMTATSNKLNWKTLQIQTANWYPIVIWHTKCMHAKVVLVYVMHSIIIVPWNLYVPATLLALHEQSPHTRLLICLDNSYNCCCRRSMYKMVSKRVVHCNDCPIGVCLHQYLDLYTYIALVHPLVSYYGYARTLV